MAKSNQHTSAKSRNRSESIDRPFDPKLLKRARDVAEQYQIILSFEDGEYYGRALEYPTAMNDGKTPDECVRNTIDILTTTLATMLERGETPPPPASENKRTEQVNFRVTPEEKLLLEQTAREKGFRGISELIRNTTLASIR